MKNENKVAIVTGSTGGFGKAIAESLVCSGWNVVITSRSIDAAQATVDELKNGQKTGCTGELIPCQFSLEKHQDAENMIQHTIDKFGRLDALVNNAISHSSLPPLPLENLAYDQLQSGMLCNMQNLLWLTSKAFPYLKETKGTVLNVGSAVVNRYPLGIPLYAILKGALQQSTKVLAAEWAEFGIRVNQINPGFSESDAYKSIGITKDQVSDMLAYYKQFHSLNRIGTPKDIKSLVTFLLSDSAQWMTGSVIDIDGGYSVQGIAPPY